MTKSPRMSTRLADSLRETACTSLKNMMQLSPGRASVARMENLGGFQKQTRGGSIEVAWSGDEKHETDVKTQAAELSTLPV